MNLLFHPLLTKTILQIVEAISKGRVCIVLNKFIMLYRECI